MSLNDLLIKTCDMKIIDANTPKAKTKLINPFMQKTKLNMYITLSPTQKIGVNQQKIMNRAKEKENNRVKVKSTLAFVGNLTTPKASNSSFL
jgi:energy-converting hydrogenase Eha subunit H